jgi:tetratricopeptide (TPR) repeat protein
MGEFQLALPTDFCYFIFGSEDVRLPCFIVNHHPRASFTKYGPDWAVQLSDREEENVGLIKELFGRRVPQVLGIYLGISWGVIQFLDWAVSRYAMSPHLTEFGLVTLACMIPTVLLLAYYHGRPGHDQWVKVEKIGIPMNILVAGIVLFFTFSGKDLGATTTRVTVETEDGKKVEREIAKSAFRKRVVSFFFDNQTGDDKQDWTQYAIPMLLDLDLSQDHFLSFKSGYDCYKQTKEAGYASGVKIPLTLKAKIATGMHMKYFMSGSVKAEQGEWRVDVLLYETERGKLLTENSYSGSDIFRLADEISLQLKRDVELPKAHIEATQDLPVMDRVTTSLPAFQEYLAGLNSLLLNEDWPKAISHFENAVATDPTFALAYSQLQSGYLFVNQSDKLTQIVPPLMQHLHKLPERLQLLVKQFYYYNIKQDPDRGFNVIKMWADLYPDDIAAHQALASVHRQSNQLEEAIAEYQRILMLDPERYDMLNTIGSLHQQRGDFERALEYYQRYAEQFPREAESFTAIGRLYMTMGQYDDAKTNFDNALVFEPQDVSILLDLADIESRLGHFNQADDQYQEALDISQSPRDRFEVYDKLVSFCEMKGQPSQALEFTNLKITEGERFLPPIIALMHKLQNLDKHVKVGNSEFALKRLGEIKAQTQPPFDKTLPIGDLRVYLALEDADRAQEAVAGVEALIQTFKLEMLRPLVLNGQGRIHVLRQEHDLAIQSFEKQLELDPTEADINREIGQAYRKSADFQKAEQYLKTHLKLFPFDPRTNYEMALTYWEMGKQDAAMESLKKALTGWEGADAKFKPAQEAQARLAEWKKSVVATES